MSIPPHHFEELLAAAKSFFDAPDRDSLMEAIELQSARLLGALEAKMVLPSSRNTVSDDLALQFGLTEDMLGEDSADELRKQLEPFHSSAVVHSSEDSTPHGEALRSLFPQQAVLACAVRTGSHFAGVIAVLDEAGERRFTAAEYLVLHELAEFAGRALRFEEIASEREARDGLTGLFDQQYLRRELRAELERRPQGPSTVVMFDIDHFKRINDTAGHSAGDDVLRMVSAFVREKSRPSDVTVRYGGEEFAVMLPSADEPAGVAFGERLREAIAEVEPGGWGGWPETVTISVGVATFPEAATDEQSLIDAADQALYRAKRGGRNQVRRASEPTE